MRESVFLYDIYDQSFVQQLSCQISFDFFPYELSQFDNGELFSKINCDVENRDVYILVKTSKEIQNFQNTIFVITEVYNKKAKSINVISFYIPYLRQFSREKLKNISDVLIKTIFRSGANRVITLDPHLKNFAKSYRDKVTILSAKDLFIEKIKGLHLGDFVFIAPDAGAKKINSDLAKYFGRQVIIAEKVRNQDSGKIEKLSLPQENIKSGNVLIVDDMIDSGTTMNLLIELILQKNPEVNIFIFCSHPIFSQPLTFLNIKQVKLLFTTDSFSDITLQNSKIVVETLKNILVDFIKKFKK